MSVMRRSLVIVHKARFLSAPDLAASFPAGDTAEHEFFLKDASLKEFVTSPDAARAFMTRLQERAFWTGMRREEME